jgi:drug/metabolite transporter (DMT)-like permease
MGVFFAFLLIALEEVGWLFAMAAVVVAVLCLWRNSRRVRRLYWATFFLIIAGNLVLLFSGGFGFWRRALFGPPAGDRLAEWFEFLNVLNSLLLLFFFLAPALRRRRRSAPGVAVRE